MFEVIVCYGLMSMLMKVETWQCVAASSGRRPEASPSISNVDSGRGYRSSRV